jgi:hypothetical protein
MKQAFSIFARIAAVFPLLLLPCCDKFPEEEATSPIVINEFMAKNTSDNPAMIADEYGESDDWIELYNPADTQVSLKDLYLADNPASLHKYALFDTILSPHGYVVIWADGQPDQGKQHADFKLSATNGDQIILSNSRGRIIDQIQFLATSGNPEARLPDQSYGRSNDGASTWCRQSAPTPSAKNSGCLKQ